MYDDTLLQWQICLDCLCAMALLQKVLRYTGGLLLPGYTHNTITEASWLACTTKEMLRYSSSSSFGSFIMIFVHKRTRYIQLVIENKDTQLADYTEYDRVKILLYNWM